MVSFILSSVSHDLPGRLKSSPRSRGPQKIAGGELGARRVRPYFGTVERGEQNLGLVSIERLAATLRRLTDLGVPPEQAAPLIGSGSKLGNRWLVYLTLAPAKGDRRSARSLTGAASCGRRPSGRSRRRDRDRHSHSRILPAASSPAGAIGPRGRSGPRPSATTRHGAS